MDTGANSVIHNVVIATIVTRALVVCICSVILDIGEASARVNVTVIALHVTRVLDVASAIMDTGEKNVISSVIAIALHVIRALAV